MNQSSKSLQWLAIILFGAIVAIVSIKLEKKYNPPFNSAPLPMDVLPKVITPITPRLPIIQNASPHHLDYSQIVQQISQWNQEAPDLTEIGTYGKSTQNKDLMYIRLTNKLNYPAKPVLLIHSCIHGNEPLATACIMNYIGNMLASYGKDQGITQLLDTRDIYFVPVVSPDSYPNSRLIDGVDPNRDYPGPLRPNHQSSRSVAAIQTFSKQIKPNAVISGHTYGRIYLYPYGYTFNLSPNDSDYQRILGQMSQLSGYKIMRGCNIYNSIINGSELDWYYLKGYPASLSNGTTIYRGAFTIVCEFGTHQQIPSPQDIQTEFSKTWRSFLYFAKEAPLVEIWWDEQGNAINSDGSKK